MRGHSRSFWHCPGWPNLRFAVMLGLAQAALFAVVYGGADWVTHQHSYRARVHLDADLAMPMVPGMALLYLSLIPLLWLAPFVLRSRRELLAYVMALAAATVAASVFFLAVPAADAFAPPDDETLGYFLPVYRVASALAGRHNYLPSLHVTFTTICILIYSGAAGALGKLVLGTWGAAIVASTLLTHQHYLLDVFSGLLLGAGAVYFAYLPRVPRRPPAAVETHRATRSRDRARLA